jgi:hypothetical protein
VTRESAPKGAPAVPGQRFQAQDTPSGREPHGPGREAAERVHSAAVVAAALDDGRWDVDVEVLDALVALLESASRWALFAELGEAA